MTTWKVLSIQSHKHEDGFTDVVHMVTWICSDTDGTNTVQVGGDTEVDPPTQNFIPYQNLTETIVLDWVKSKINPTQIESNLQQQLTYMANPPLETLPLPWN